MASPLIKKLRLAVARNALFLNAPENYVESLGELPDGLAVSTEAAVSCDFVQVFVKDSGQFNMLVPQATAAAADDAIYWICFPKKSAKGITSDLSRDIVWEMMKGSGLRPVSNISIDDTWSALRFRPEDKVGR